MNTSNLNVTNSMNRLNVTNSLSHLSITRSTSRPNMHLHAAVQVHTWTGHVNSTNSISHRNITDSNESCHTLCHVPHCVMSHIGTGHLNSTNTRSRRNIIISIIHANITNPRSHWNGSLRRSKKNIAKCDCLEIQISYKSGHLRGRMDSIFRWYEWKKGGGRVLSVRHACRLGCAWQCVVCWWLVCKTCVSVLACQCRCKLPMSVCRV